MSDGADILDGTLHDAVKAVRSGDIRAAELIEAALARIAATPEAAACFVDVDRRGASAAAARLDAGDRGRTAGLTLPGIPIAHKDLFSRVGRTARFCSHPDFRRTGHTDAEVLARLDRAGAIDLGALHLSEFAMGPSGWNPVHGFLVNPHDPARVTGGSSSGSAAAVAGRLVHGALGTDTGGSIRIPAAFCGVVSLKPTNGLIPVRGVYPVSTSLDTVGPLARDATDCGLLFAAMSGRPAPTAPAERLRFAVLAADCLPTAPDASVAAALQAIAEGLAAAGYAVVPARAPLAELNLLSSIVFLSEAAAQHLPHLSGGAERIGAQVRDRLLQGLGYPAAIYLRALAERPRHSRAFHAQAFADADVLLLPTTPYPAPLRQTYDEMDDAAQPLELNGRLASYTPAFNYLETPVLSLPAQRAAQRSTIGLQIVAPRGRDELALAAGQVIESIRDRVLS